MRGKLRRRPLLPMHRPMILLILLAGTALLWFQLDRLSLSVDEFVNVILERGDWQAIVADLRAGVDLHPPLTHFIMSGWLRLVGESEWTVRFLWTLAAILNLALTYRLAFLLLDRTTGLLAATLVLTLPTFLLYSRFEKYYSLTVTFSLLLLIAGIYLWRAPTPRRAIFYTLALAALLYTDYLAPLFLVLAQDIVMFIYGRRRSQLIAFLGSQALAALLFLPWLAVLAAQAQTLQGSLAADLGARWTGFVLRLAYLPVSFGMGETILPWEGTAIVGAIALLIAGVAGMMRLTRGWRSGDPPAGALVLIILLLSLLGAAWLTNFVFSSVPFIAFPNHVFFLLPLVAIVVAAGLRAIRSFAPRVLLFIFILFPRLVGIDNYYQGLDYHNPIYAVPMREVAEKVLAESAPGDVVVSAYDTGFGYYYDRLTAAPGATTSPPDSLVLGKSADAIRALAAAQPPRVWLLRFGRDRTEALAPEPEVAAWLETAGYFVAAEERYVLLNLTYVSVKQNLLDRDSYDAKLYVDLYQLPETP
ncbi:MAG: glycosyltransferase family 39 protein [Caldilineaceae bacterium]|nr:glycosyltransferase family 39 protein [Caldilineaceae bacterium]